MQKVKLLVIVLCLALFTSCEQAQLENDKQEIKSDAPPPQQAGYQDSTTTAIRQTQTNIKSNIDHEWDRKIIKSASLSVVVKKPEDYYKQVRNTVSQLGGYVAQEERSINESFVQNKVSIRVPVEQFDEMMMKLSEGADSIVDRKIQSQDVGGEIMDTRARLETKKLVRQQYANLLKETHNMQEILSVQNEINAVQEQVEATDGRINYLRHAASFSTIELVYWQDAKQLIDPKDSPSFIDQLLEAFAVGGRLIARLVLGLVTLWPLWFFGFLLMWGYRRMKLVQKAKG